MSPGLDDVVNLSLLFAEGPQLREYRLVVPLHELLRIDLHLPQHLLSFFDLNWSSSFRSRRPHQEHHHKHRRILLSQLLLLVIPSFDLLPFLVCAGFSFLSPQDSGRNQKSRLSDFDSTSRHHFLHLRTRLLASSSFAVFLGFSSTQLLVLLDILAAKSAGQHSLCLLAHPSL